MIEITKESKQVVFDYKDQNKLLIELEDMFILSDTEIEGHYYSMATIERKYPKVAELYRLLREGR